uniref:NADH dehydrogenase subunit 1 n=1 Tax=Romanomermis culicivorax TaxID=13658 RepID=A0A915J0L3_ROMCU
MVSIRYLESMEGVVSLNPFYFIALTLKKAVGELFYFVSLSFVILFCIVLCASLWTSGSWTCLTQ